MATLQELLQRSSRTFAVGIDLLPEPLRREITVAYLLLRVSDHLEDSKILDDRDKIALLGRWASALETPGGDDDLIATLALTREETPDALVARHAGSVLEALGALDPAAREIVTRRVRESTLGMARWTRRGSDFGAEADLDDYMHEVAGRVGLLLTELFRARLSGLRERRGLPERLDSGASRDRPEPDGGRAPGAMMALGRSFGLGLQTVNVIRGLHEDPSRGWVYVPRDFVPGPEAQGGALFHPSNAQAALGVLNALAAKADRHLADARAYVRMIPRRHHRVRLFCILPLLFAVRTLALSRGNPEVLRREVKMTRAEVLAITRSARVMGFSNTWLDSCCDRLAVARASAAGAF